MYDIIIPTASKDVGFIHLVFEYIRKNLKEADIIYVITNRSCFNKIQKYDLKHFNVILLDENELIQSLSFERIQKILLSQDVHIRVGWYFQQFLKMAFALTKYSKDYYLTWDSDTLPLNHISFFDDKERPLFTMKAEFNQPYFDTLQKLLGFGKLAPFSFIAEHMMFNSNIMKELINRIETNNSKGSDWVEKILFACTDLQEPCFSEFETYGSYVWKFHPNMYGVQKLNTFRSAGIIKGRHIDSYCLERMALDLDTASFELFDKPPFQYRFDYYAHIWRQRFRQLKGRSIRSTYNLILNWLRRN